LFALQEVLERDATAMWWLSGSAAVGIDIAHHPAISAVFDPREVPDLAVSFFHIRSSFDVPVIGVFVEDTARSLVAFGSACRSAPVEATSKALTEVFDVLSLSVALLDPDGFLAAAAGGPHYRPFRADRAYLDDFRPDWRDVNDLPAHAQLHLDPRMRGPVLERIRAPHQRTALEDLSSFTAPHGLASYVEHIESAGLKVYAADLTTADIATAGLRVSRVLVPGLYCNAPAAFPFLGGGRLYTEPVLRGWTDTPVTEDTLVRHPLPHT